jgi:hypothetical protein
MKNNGSPHIYAIDLAALDQAVRELSGVKFSPGPWLKRDFQGTPLIENRQGQIITVLAQRTVGKEEAWANATLIENAPDLYKALDALVIAAYDPDEGDCLICGAQCAWGAGPHEGTCEVEAAVEWLARARGETR